MKVVDLVYNISKNIERTHRPTSAKFRDMRIEATKRAGLYHVEVKNYGAVLGWIVDNGTPDYTYSMDDFWFDDPNVAFEVKMRFG